MPEYPNPTTRFLNGLKPIAAELKTIIDTKRDGGAIPLDVYIDADNIIADIDMRLYTMTDEEQVDMLNDIHGLLFDLHSGNYLKGDVYDRLGERLVNIAEDFALIASDGQFQTYAAQAEQALKNFQAACASMTSLDPRVLAKVSIHELDAAFGKVSKARLEATHPVDGSKQRNDGQESR